MKEIGNIKEVETKFGRWYPGDLAYIETFSLESSIKETTCSQLFVGALF